MENVLINGANEYESELLANYRKANDDFLEKKKAYSQVKKEYKEAKKAYRLRVSQILKSEVKQDSNDALYQIKSFYQKKNIDLRTEIYNAISHGIGAALGIVGLILLLIKADTTLEYVAYSIYGASIIMLFLASTLYHSLVYTKAKNVFRVIDHSSIFLLIAGTYTPYVLLSVGGNKGVYYFGTIWVLAILGIVMKIFFFEKSKKVSSLIYLAMGWLCLVFIGDLYMAIGLRGLSLLAAGGVVYSLGVIFYKKKDLNFSHVIWHFFVLAGAVLMFFSIYLYV